MKSLHSLENSKIFKYKEFTDEEAQRLGGNVSLLSSSPYVTFNDDDFITRKEKPVPVKEKKPVVPTAIEKIDEVENHMKSAVARAEQIIMDAEKEARVKIETAGEKAERLLSDAKQESQKLFAESKDTGHKKGYDEGLIKGGETGRAEQQEVLEALKTRYKTFFETIDEACESIDLQKQEFLRQNIQDLSDLALAVAEKIVGVSLESTGEIVKKMIMSAALPAGSQQWAKVMISAKDAKMLEEDNIDIKQELYTITDKVDLIIAEDAKPGTCMIEFPDQAIDVGVETQIRNIKLAMRDTEKEQVAAVVL